MHAEARTLADWFNLKVSGLLLGMKMCVIPRCPCDSILVP